MLYNILIFFLGLIAFIRLIMAIHSYRKSFSKNSKEYFELKKKYPLELVDSNFPLHQSDQELRISNSGSNLCGEEISFDYHDYCESIIIAKGRFCI